MNFIQVGEWVFATSQIAAICVNSTTNMGDPAVSLYLTGNNDPWKFRHGTKEASALIDYVHEHACVLAPLNHDIR